MAGPNTKEFTDSNFESDVIKSNQPVLVDFWAEWCMPCKALGPTIDELASDYAGKVKVGKLNTDSNIQTASKFGISSIPTMLIFKDGQIVKQLVGLRSKKEIASALDSVAK